MSKILLTLLVAGVSFSGIQGAVAIKVEKDQEQRNVKTTPRKPPVKKYLATPENAKNRIKREHISSDLANRSPMILFRVNETKQELKKPFTKMRIQDGKMSVLGTHNVWVEAHLNLGTPLHTAVQAPLPMVVLTFCK